MYMYDGALKKLDKKIVRDTASVCVIMYLRYTRGMIALLLNILMNSTLRKDNYYFIFS